MNPIQIGIGIFIVCVLLIIGVIVFKRVTTATATATGQPSLQLKPILSARVTALKTGDSKVSGYSFRGLREYDNGNCTFQPSMNKYVSMVVDLTLVADPGLSSVSQVKAVWWTGGTPGTPGTPGTEWSTGTVNGPLTGPQTLSLTIPPNITNTITNIACAGNQDAFNRILIWYNSSFDPTYKLWATIEIPTLGTAITTAFTSIATGTGTPLTVTLTAPNAADVTVGSTQAIPYKFTSKTAIPVVVIGITLKKKTDADTYEMKYMGTTVNVKSNKYDNNELPGYSEYVSFQVLDVGVKQNKYISFVVANELLYKETPDDSCFFKISVAMGCTPGSDVTPTSPAWGACSKLCGTGIRERRVWGSRVEGITYVSCSEIQSKKCNIFGCNTENTGNYFIGTPYIGKINAAPKKMMFALYIDSNILINYLQTYYSTQNSIFHIHSFLGGLIYSDRNIIKDNTPKSILVTHGAGNGGYPTVNTPPGTDEVLFILSTSDKTNEDIKIRPNRIFVLLYNSVLIQATDEFSLTPFMKSITVTNLNSYDDLVVSPLNLPEDCMRVVTNDYVWTSTNSPAGYSTLEECNTTFTTYMKTINSEYFL